MYHGEKCTPPRELLWPEYIFFFPSHQHYNEMTLFDDILYRKTLNNTDYIRCQKDGHIRRGTFALKERYSHFLGLLQQVIIN